MKSPAPLIHSQDFIQTEFVLPGKLNEYIIGAPNLKKSMWTIKQLIFHHRSSTLHEQKLSLLISLLLK